MSETAAERTIREILEYRCPRYEQFPAIPLYRDQVIDALNFYMAPFLSSEEDQAITASMINNYVKQHLLPPPVKKRYDRDHMARLYAICMLKQVFSISEIQGLLDIQTRTYPFPTAYDYFCTELEKALQSTFSTRDFSAPSSAHHVTAESELVRGSALTIANKIFTTKFLLLYDLESPAQDETP